MQIRVRKKNINEQELAKALAGYIQQENIVDSILERLIKSDDHEHKDPIPEKYIRYIGERIKKEFRSLMSTLTHNLDRWFSFVSMKPSGLFGWRKKAKLPQLSDEEMNELRQLIEGHFRAAIGLGFNVPNDTQKRWKKAGIQAPTENIEQWITRSYVAGRLSEVLDNNNSYADMLREAKKLRMSRQDELMLEAAKQNSAKYIKGYGKKLADIAEEVMLQNHKNNISKVVQSYFSGDLKHTTYNGEGFSPQEVDELIATEKEVKGWKELSTELKNRFKAEDIGRDWDRVAFTEIRYATNTGRIMNIQVEGGGDPEDVELYYNVQPTACKYCKKLYLKEDGDPKIFKLSEILQNAEETGGMNIGLSAGKIGETGGWLPNIVSHPHCHCAMNRLIPGFKPIK